MAARAQRTRPAKKPGRTTPAKPKVTLAAPDELALLKARVYDLMALQQQCQAEINQCNQRIGELAGAPVKPEPSPE